RSVRAPPKPNKAISSAPASRYRFRSSVLIGLVYGDTASLTSERLRPLAFNSSSMRLIFSAASSGNRLKPIQPSPYSATRRNAGLLSPPNHTGTPLPLTGFG